MKLTVEQVNQDIQTLLEMSTRYQDMVAGGESHSDFASGARTLGRLKEVLLAAEDKNIHLFPKDATNVT